MFIFLFTCTHTDHFDSFIQGPLISILNSHDFTCGSTCCIWPWLCQARKKNKILHLF